MSHGPPFEDAPPPLRAAFLAGQYSSDGPREHQAAEQEWNKACEMFAELTRPPAAPSRTDYEVPFYRGLWRVVVEADHGTWNISTFCLCDSAADALEACRRFFEWPPIVIVPDPWNNAPGNSRAETPALCAAYRVNVYPTVFEIAIKVYPVRAIDALRESYVE